MNIYNEKPQRVNTIKTIGEYLTFFHLNPRELTRAERDENGIVGTYLDENDNEVRQEAWTSEDILYRHKEPLTESDYGRMVACIVRTRYSADDVEAITQNYIASKTAEHKDEWQALQDWRDTAKALAREALGL